jgi:hypothetical protein
MDSPDRGTISDHPARFARERLLAGLAVAVSALLVAAMIALALSAFGVSLPGA